MCQITDGLQSDCTGCSDRGAAGSHLAALLGPSALAAELHGATGKRRQFPECHGPAAASSWGSGDTAARMSGCRGQGGGTGSARRQLPHGAAWGHWCRGRIRTCQAASAGVSAPHVHQLRAAAFRGGGDPPRGLSSLTCVTADQTSHSLSPVSTHPLLAQHTHTERALGAGAAPTEQRVVNKTDEVSAPLKVSSQTLVQAFSPVKWR